MELTEINFLDVDETKEYDKIVGQVIKKCFEEENLLNKNLYVNIVLTTAEQIKNINKEHRGIDKETDVLSFPMFEVNEIENINPETEDVLGDVVISLEQIKKQAKEYGHTLERELAYMLVHSFYHLMGYDHMKEEDKKIMRAKEDIILEKLNIKR
jgi:probable rRNA maturation factor